MSHYDIEFFWDPVCPFAWITSRWITKVSAQTGYKVDWRLISLRLLNKDKDYATEFPPNYERGHTAGLRMLRVAAKIRAELGREHMGVLYEGYGRAYWDQSKGLGMSQKLGTVAHIEEVLHAIGLPTACATAADDPSWDAELDAETALALSRTGRDVGTPIITFAPPDGVSFFGPVISRIPRDEEAVTLWNAVLTLAQFPGFAELKRSLREAPQLRILGHLGDTPPARGVEGWTSCRRTARKTGIAPMWGRGACFLHRVVFQMSCHAGSMAHLSWSPEEDARPCPGPSSRLAGW